ncbi:hypothetical protein BKA70DRAFT_1433941 [Coprinopsis sp. MPI-PUGE-AT-0042]|nr:hypothetical protein BKA70DRAFT_1433941 [Coprinopsis sp. MPI-PUGE-AT-0042]
MVAHSRLLPPEVEGEILSNLTFGELLQTATASFALCQLTETELWSRLAMLLSPFLHLSQDFTIPFCRLMTHTGAAIVGYVALQLLLLESFSASGEAACYKHIDIAVNVNSFAATIDFFKCIGYNFTQVEWKYPSTDAPDVDTIVGLAVGCLPPDEAGRIHEVHIHATLSSPISYFFEMGATHHMNAITATGIYCFYPHLTLNGEGLAIDDAEPLVNIDLFAANGHWSKTQCGRYCPAKPRDTRNDPSILAYSWKRPLDRSDPEDNVYQQMDTESLILTGRCNHSTDHLIDLELRSRLRWILSRFVSPASQPTGDFFKLFVDSNMTITGFAPLHLLVFGKPWAASIGDVYKLLELVVHVGSFSDVVQFFRNLGYTDFTFEWPTVGEEPQNNEIVAIAVGQISNSQTDEVLSVQITATVGNHFPSILRSSATHLANAITPVAMYSFFPKLTLAGTGLADLSHMRFDGF